MSHHQQNVELGQYLMALGVIQREQARVSFEIASAQQRSLLAVLVDQGVLPMDQAQQFFEQFQASKNQPSHSSSRAISGPPASADVTIKGESSSQNPSMLPPAPGSSPEAKTMLSSGPPSSQSANALARPPSSGSWSAEANLPKVGELFDGYEIVRLLGKGGMGAVFLARHSGADYALKIIITDNPSALKRFEREALAAAAVDSHANVVRIHKFAFFNGVPYLLLDFIEGRGLDDIIKDQAPMSAERSLAILKPIAEALDFMHQRGIVHRDLKPANVLIRDDDKRPLLTDFGLAKAADSEALTKSTDVIGTPQYMAPEQAGSEHDQVGVHSDVWALGVMLYEMTSGERPFKGETMLQIAKQVMFEEPRPLRELKPELPEAISVIVEHCLQKEPKHRLKSAGQFARDCELFLAGEPISSVRLSWLQRKQRSMKRQYGKRVFVIAGLFLLVLAGFGLAIPSYLQYEAARQARQQSLIEAWNQVTDKLEPFRKRPLVFSSLTIMKAAQIDNLWPERLKLDFETLQNQAREFDQDYQNFLILSQSQRDMAWIDKDKDRDLLIVLVLACHKQGSAETTRNKGLRLFTTALALLRAGETTKAERAFETLSRKTSKLALLGQVGLASQALSGKRWKDAKARFEALRKRDSLSRIIEPMFQLCLQQNSILELFAEAKQPRATENLLRTIDQAILLLSEAERVNFWKQWNARLAKALADQKRDSESLTTLSLVYENVKKASLKRTEIRSPPLTGPVHKALAKRALDKDLLPEALFHYLKAKRIDPKSELPSRFLPSRLNGLVLQIGTLGAGSKDKRKNLKRCLDILLSVSRAGIYVPVAHAALLRSIFNEGLLNEAVSQNPDDPIPLFYRGQVTVDPEEDARDYKAGLRHAQRALRDLNEAIRLSHRMSRSLLAVAYAQRGYWHCKGETLRILAGGKSSQDKKANMTAFNNARRDCQQALEVGLHPRPDKIWELIARIEGKYKNRGFVNAVIDKQVWLTASRAWIKALEDRRRRTESGTLDQGRPFGAEMVSLGSSQYRRLMAVAHKHLARSSYANENYEEALSAARAAAVHLSQTDLRDPDVPATELKCLLTLKRFKAAEAFFLKHKDGWPDEWRTRFMEPIFADFKRPIPK